MRNNELYSRVAEEGLIGSLLLDSSAYSKIALKKLEPLDFYVPEYRLIFGIMKSFADKNKPWDVVLISDEIKASAKENSPVLSDVIALVRNTPGTSNIEAYADVVMERSILRKLIGELDLVAKKIQDPLARDSQEILDACLKSINTLRDSKLVTTKKVESLNSSYDNFIDNITKRRISNSNFEGIISLLPSVDTLTGGFCNGHFIVIAARPSVGKSALGLFFSAKALMQSKNVLFWSTEMNNNTILARMFSQFCHIPAYNITHNPKNLLQKDLDSISEWSDAFDTFFVETGYAHIKAVCDKARMMHRQGSLDILVVDYLQNLKGDGDGPVEKLNQISGELKKLAMELNIPVIALAQLNRQAQHMDVPSIAEIKGSGAIEQDADLIIILHQNQNESPEKHWLLCAKNRHGETKNIPVVFNKPYQTFLEDQPMGRVLFKKNVRSSEL